jgi:uncharacterized iron-regulated membrane protein
MNHFFMPSAGSPVMDWLIFAAILLLICLGIAGFFVWLKVFRQKRKKSQPKKRKHRHHRHTNPTLAQTGGLPPKRDPNQPLAGP